MDLDQVSKILSITERLLPLVAGGVAGAYEELSALFAAVRPAGDVSDVDEAAARERGRAAVRRIDARAEQAKAFLAKQASA